MNIFELLAEREEALQKAAGLAGMLGAGALGLAKGVGALGIKAVKNPMTTLNVALNAGDGIAKQRQYSRLPSQLAQSTARLPSLGGATF